MAWTAANPVSVGAATKKDDYDTAWDNADYLLDAREDADGDSTAFFTADDVYKINLGGNDALALTAASIIAKIGATEQLALSQYGMTLKTSRASAYINASTNQSVASGSWVKMTLDEEQFDELSEFDKTTNYRLTVTEPGYYFCYAQAIFDSPSDQDVIEIKIRKNGSTDLCQAERPVSNSGADQDTINTAGIFSLSASDFLEVYVQHDHGSALTLVDGEGQSIFAVHRLS